MKRWIAMLLVVVTVFALLPAMSVSAGAAYYGGFRDNNIGYAVNVNWDQYYESDYFQHKYGDEGTWTGGRDWQWPIENYSITSCYGVDGDEGELRFHWAIDIGGYTDQEIRASYAGVVIDCGNHGDGCGNCVVIQHEYNGLNLFSKYSHLNYIDKGVSINKPLNKGDLIGGCGATGGNYGVHLDFQVLSQEIAQGSGGRLKTIDPLKAELFSGDVIERLLGWQERCKQHINETNDIYKRFSVIDINDGGEFEANDINATANIPIKEEPNDEAKTTGIIGYLKEWIDFHASLVGNFFKNAWDWVTHLFANSVSELRTVNVLGVVTNEKGEKWYKLEGEQYVKKSEFDKYFHRIGPASSMAVGDASIQFSNIGYPNGSVKQGAYPLSGAIASSSNITQIYGAVVDAATDQPCTYTSVYPGTTAYNIRGSSLDNGIVFQRLSVGHTYYLTYVVKNAVGATKVWKSPNFTVTAASVAAPMISANSIRNGQQAVITCPDGGATMYVTCDGSTASGSGSITLNLTEPGCHSISAYATKNGVRSNTVNSSVYVSRVATPVIQEPIFQKDRAVVTISGDGEIHYTTNGATPTESSPVFTEPLYLTDSMTIKAVAYNYGYAPSEVSEKHALIAPPDAPNIQLDTKDRLAQGKTTSVSWSPAPRAYEYTASLLRDGKIVETKTVQGTTVAFALSERNDNEDLQYTIKVTASNFKGSSGESNYLTVWGMHPVMVRFVDKINRTATVTDQVVKEVWERMVQYYGAENVAKLEGNELSRQKVDYDEKPAQPETPSKEGFTFSGWSAGLYEPATEDKIVYAGFDINYYTVRFYDSNNVVRGKLLSNGRIGDRYMYSEAVTPPTDFDTPEFYKHIGWNVDTSASDCLDYNFVKGNMVLDAVYAWGNADLPVAIQITDVSRNDKSYMVDIQMKTSSAELDGQRIRVITSLYTAEGRNLYTQVRDHDVKFEGEIRQWDKNDTITLNYGEKASRVAVYVVKTENDRTGAVLSETSESRNIRYVGESFWTPWSEWSSEKPTESQNAEIQVRYRYRDKEYKTSNASKTLSGWTRYKEEVTGNSGWISTGTSYVSSGWINDCTYRQASSTYMPAGYKTQYHYYRFYNGMSAPWTHYSSSHPYCEEYWADYELPWKRYSGEMNQYGDGYTGNSGSIYWLICDGSTFGGKDAIERGYISDGRFTRTVMTSSAYTAYQYCDTYYRYHFWRYPDTWQISDEQVYASDSREVYKEYRYRTRTNTDAQEESTVFEGVLNGKLTSAGVEYITEAEYSAKPRKLISGPYYKTDDGEYALISENQKTTTQYRYGRYTNGTYVMPCKEAAEERYGGQWVLEFTEWSESPAASVTENVYSCNVPEHEHESSQWNNYTVNGESYCIEEIRTISEDVTYTDPTKYYLVSTDLEGKSGLVMFYKRTNTDPTQGQIEYVEQFQFGPENSYEIHYNTKELLDFEKTGDFIVSLAIEGGQGLTNLAVLEAPVPEYTVEFYKANGELYKTESVKLGGAADVYAVGIPEQEGYRFVRWDKSVVNVKENMKVTAEVEPIDYPVVFVDYANATTELMELPYGSPVPSPTVEPVKGKVFRGWIVPEDASTVTKAMIIEAEWMPEIYTVKFCDLTGTVVSEQQVEYGESATPPKALILDGQSYSWSLTGGEWWNVTSDLVIYPCSNVLPSVAAPTINASADEVSGTFYAELSTSEESGKIYYAMSEEITEDIAREFIDHRTMEMDMPLLSLLSEEQENQPSDYSEWEGIQEYTEPILVFEGAIVYAFTVNDQNEISPIAVFEYGYDNSEDEGIIPNTYEVDPKSQQITMPNVTVKPGATVTIPVSIKNNPGLKNLSLIFSFDAKNLTLTKAENGNVFRNTEFSSDVKTDGSCKFTWLSNTVNNLDGTLLNLTFRAGEAASKDSVNMDISNASSADGSQMPFVTVNSDVTNLGDQYLSGDVNGDEKVTFADAILLIRYDVGLTTLNSKQLQVADVNHDGDADFADAVMILRYDAGLITVLN